jgi:hypothetical protein
VKRTILALIISAFAVLALTSPGASAAVNGPTPTVGYHYDGSFSPKGEPNQCYTVIDVKGVYEVGIFSCPGGIGTPDQQWIMLAISNSVEIAWAGNPKLVLGGIPNGDGYVELIHLDKHGNVPLPQSTFIYGSRTKPGATNYVVNYHRQLLAAPKSGHAARWVGILSRGMSTKAIVINGVWIAEHAI